MLRGFTDSTGVEWRVWEVLPTAGGPSAVQAFGKSLKETPFANGWLCFESSLEKRRLAPVPSGWEGHDPSVLQQLCQQALPVAVRRARAELTGTPVSAA
jgi:hypothetical protein